MTPTRARTSSCAYTRTATRASRARSARSAPTCRRSCRASSRASRRDQWAEWLLHRRHGGDPEALRKTLEWLYPVRDRVLSNAALREGDVVLDVGCGDGLIAFGALEKVGSSGRVIFSDISQDLLEHSRALAGEMGVLDRCDFVLAAAEDLAPIADASLDVVTTRSVIIYVKGKAAAFSEFHRVLKPGGRLSAFEPINRFNEPRSESVSYDGFDMTPVIDIYGRIRDFYRRLQPRDTDPMLDFDERDLVELADRAGFAEVHLELHAEIAPPKEKANWEQAIRRAFNPKVPSLEEAMRELLTPEEIERYTAYVRPLVESGAGRARKAYAYLWARK